MELWDIYDIDRQKTGKLCRRVDGKALADQDYHLVVHICLFNPHGQLLIQRRQLDKAGYPGLWDSPRFYKRTPCLHRQFSRRL